MTVDEFREVENFQAMEVPPENRCYQAWKFSMLHMTAGADWLCRVWAQQWDVSSIYCWVVPMRWIVDEIARFAPDIVEVGCGGGFLGSLLLEAGARWIGYDKCHPWLSYNKYVEPTCRWAPVRVGDEASVVKHPGSVLLICWPPHGGFPMRVIENMAPRKLVLWADWRGSHADGEFFDVLEDEYHVVREIVTPTWPGGKDRLYLMEMRG